jgi:hypothetical protein
LRAGVLRVAGSAILVHAMGGITQMKRDCVRFYDDAVQMALDQVAVAGRFTGSVIGDRSETISKGLDDQR